MNNYIIPTNTKKSQLIFGFFTLTDLVLFGTGCATTIIFLMAIHNASFGEMLLMLMPALVTGFLVTPVMYYHNVLQLITNIVTYFLNTRRYYWKGWCLYDEIK